MIEEAIAKFEQVGRLLRGGCWAEHVLGMGGSGGERPGCTAFALATRTAAWAWPCGPRPQCPPPVIHAPQPHPTPLPLPCAQALGIDANRHDALWCLGNAYTSQGFLSAEAASGAGRRNLPACLPCLAAWLACLQRLMPCPVWSQPPVLRRAHLLRLLPPTAPSPTALLPHSLPTHATASDYFDKAGGCFRKAVELEPGNDSYRRALEMSAKAPQLYAELQRQLAAAGAGGGSPRASSEGRGTGAAKQVRLGGGGRGAGLPASPAWLASASRLCSHTEAVLPSSSSPRRPPSSPTFGTTWRAGCAWWARCLVWPRCPAPAAPPPPPEHPPRRQPSLPAWGPGKASPYPATRFLLRNPAAPPIVCCATHPRALVLAAPPSSPTDHTT